ncbi:Heme chaperone HemW [Buchnera aphidicola (Tetraneura ulmi)]|uniref:radical SAM family heme chaperone HemW n=1 Tax=Buchnera aphidicola TaxID=9 RepID=UPI0034645857
MKKLPPLSLYIHIPWCTKKCPYCDFSSFPVKENIPEKKYIDHLLKDLYSNKKHYLNREIKTIFIGGGSPSLFSEKGIQFLIKEIKKNIFLSKNAEITIEVNPNTTESNKILNYLNSGINRISIGIQSFDSKLLKNIGRIHNSHETKNVIKQLVKIPNINFNVDLMYGLPNQSIKQGILDLKTAIKFQPKHISWYQLTIEPKTLFFYKTPKLPSEESSWKILQEGKKILKKLNYKQYEISSYSKKGYQCQHNLNYWKYGDYLGIGCASHSKITKENGSIIRIVKKNKIKKYMEEKCYIEKIELIKKKKRIFEYFVNNFRLFQSISKKHFYEFTGIKPKKINVEINKAKKKGYLIETKKNWKTTNNGKLFLNDLLEIFL